MSTCCVCACLVVRVPISACPPFLSFVLRSVSSLPPPRLVPLACPLSSHLLSPHLHEEADGDLHTRKLVDERGRDLVGLGQQAQAVYVCMYVYGVGAP